jgi:hypothetical protein
MDDLPTEILCYIIEFVCSHEQCNDANNVSLVCKKMHSIILHISKKHQKAHIYYEKCSNINLKETLILNKIIQDEVEKRKSELSHMFSDPHDYCLYVSNIAIESDSIILNFIIEILDEKDYKIHIVINHGIAKLSMYQTKQIRPCLTIKRNTHIFEVRKDVNKFLHDLPISTRNFDTVSRLIKEIVNVIINQIL